MPRISTDLSPHDLRALLQRLVDDDDFYAQAAANPVRVLRDEGLDLTGGAVTLPSRDALRQAAKGMGAPEEQLDAHIAFLAFVAFFGAAHFFHMATMAEPSREHFPQPQ